MICSDYNDFYHVLASSVLTLLSIFITLIIYIWQLRSRKKEEIERDIKTLTDTINYFNNILTKAVPFITVKPESCEYENMIREVITKYWEWKRENSFGSQGFFLRELNQIQRRIYSDLIHKLDFFDKKDKYNGNYEYIINIDNYELFMREVYPFLNKVEGVHTSIVGIIQENKSNWTNYYMRGDYQRHLGEFYHKYWDVILDIRNKSIDIDKKMYLYNKSIFNAILDSSTSVRWIYLTIIILFIFGVVIPFYMIQPNKIGILPCNYIFFVTVFFLVFSIVCPYISYLNRQRYVTVIDEGST